MAQATKFQRPMSFIRLKILERHVEVDVPAFHNLKRKRKGAASARAEFCYYARDEGYSTPKIAAWMGAKDHTTVIHASRRFAATLNGAAPTPLDPEIVSSSLTVT